MTGYDRLAGSIMFAILVAMLLLLLVAMMDLTARLGELKQLMMISTGTF